jgi:hypothetical protein
MEWERAEVGDLISVDGQSYRVAEETDHDELVCINLNPECAYKDEVRNFPAYMIDRVTREAKIVEVNCGGGI